jgi:hypothetical protein
MKAKTLYIDKCSPLMNKFLQCMSKGDKEGAYEVIKLSKRKQKIKKIMNNMNKSK